MFFFLFFRGIFHREIIVEEILPSESAANEINQNIPRVRPLLADFTVL